MADQAFEDLRRWERSGGQWRVLNRCGTQVTVGLFSCDGGEEMSRLTSTIAEFSAFLAGRDRSDD